jgi:acyl-CoA thioester hydrolase
MNHQISCRVYYEDTDCGKVVYYANYLKFFERGRTEFLRSFGINQSVLAIEKRVIFVVHSCHINYHHPAFLDDLLVVESKITNLGKVSITMKQHITCVNKKISSLDINLACVNANSFKPCPLPTIFQQLFYV